MELRTKNRIKLVCDTVLFISLGLASLTGILKSPLPADSISDDLFQLYHGHPWGILNFLLDWCGALALVRKRYFWLLNEICKRED